MHCTCKWASCLARTGRPKWRGTETEREKLILNWWDSIVRMSTVCKIHMCHHISWLEYFINTHTQQSRTISIFMQDELAKKTIYMENIKTYSTYPMLLFINCFSTFYLSGSAFLLLLLFVFRLPSANKHWLQWSFWSTNYAHNIGLLCATQNDKVNNDCHAWVPSINAFA